MRKNKTMRLAVLLLVLTLITSCFVGGTFAKYTSTAAGEDSVTVAKWSILVGEGSNQVDISGTDVITFDLFNTIMDTNGSNENAVATGLIAPGTKGSFDLVVENESEVVAEYDIIYTVTNTSNVPLEFSTDGTNWKTALADLNVTNKQLGIDAVADKTVVQWRWVFNGSDGTAGSDDTKDTALGIAAKNTSNAPKVTIKAQIVADQVDYVTP